jgi:hypothetical protein
MYLRHGNGKSPISTKDLEIGLFPLAGCTVYRCKWRDGAPPEMSSICIYLPRTAFQSLEKLQGPDQSPYPLAICYSLLLKMAIETVDLPIENGDFP